MKPIHLLPPFLSLVIGGGLIASQKSQINSVESETTILRKRIAVARAGSGTGGDQSLATRMKERDDAGDGGIDWKDLGEKIVEMDQGAMTDLRAMMELQTTLMELSGEDLLAELDRIDELDLGKDVRKALDALIAGQLIKKEPEAVLNRYLDRMNDSQSGMSWQLSAAFQAWQKKEPAEAMAWFDAEIAKGSFESKSLDGRSDARYRFESVAVGNLLVSNPDAAARRVAALPEEQRKHLFRHGISSGWNEENHRALAELVRASLPEEERGEAYNNTVGRLMNGGKFEKIDGFISNIDASAQERDAIVSQATRSRIQNLGWEGKVDRQAVDEARDWAMSQSPEKADGFTGKALANVWGEKSTFKERAGFVADLHAEGAGDELIVSFLDENHQIGGNREISRSLAELVGDEERKAKLLKEIGDGPSPKSDPFRTD